MSGNMSISVNGQSQVPPGFRFHPTEEELLQYYLRNKVSDEKIDLDVIRDVDLNKLEPWDIQEVCKIGTTPQNDWYFFSHKDKKYPSGTRTNRATAAGFWKATGRDKLMHSNGRRIGMRKTLVFYKGRAPRGLKSDWIMHEYRFDDNIIPDHNISNAMGETTQDEGWVVCRIFKKKNQHKTLDSPISTSRTTEARTQNCDSCCGEALESILQHMGNTSKEENEAKRSPVFLPPVDTCTKNGFHEELMKLPGLESSNFTINQNYYHSINPAMTTSNECLVTNQVSFSHDPNSGYQMDSAVLTNWTALDRLVAYQLNGQTDQPSGQLACFNDPTVTYFLDNDLQLPTVQSSSTSNRSYHLTQNYNTEIDIWSYPQPSASFSSSEPQGHVPNVTV